MGKIFNIQRIRKQASQKREIDMCNGPLFKKMLMFALPIMATNILQLMFNAADMIVVGQFSGSRALAAVGATGSLINLMVTLFMGLSIGTSVVVAQYIGAGEHDSVRKTVHTAMTVSIIGGAIVLVAGLALCEPLLVLMGTPEDIIDLSVLYMRIIFLGMPATFVFTFASAILRAAGDSKRPMYYLVISGFANVIMNLFFVAVLHMSVDGVAWATVISQYMSVIMIILCLTRCEGAICFYPKEMRIDKQMMLKIMRIGTPAGLQGMLFSLSNVLIQSGVNSFGSAMVAASAAAANVENFAGTTMMAFSSTALAFTGQNMGAKKYNRIDTIAKVSTAFVFSTWFVMCGLILLFDRQLIGFYNSDPQIIELGMQRLTVMMAMYFACGIMNVIPGVTRGMGYSILPMLCTLIGVCLMRIIWLYTIFVWYRSIFTLFLSYPVTWTLTGIGQVVIFLYARSRIRKRAAAEAKELETVETTEMCELVEPAQPAELSEPAESVNCCCR